MSYTIQKYGADIAALLDSIGDVSNLSTTAKNNLVAAINELFTSVSNGKTAVAGAITDMGVTTSPTASFSTMATNILAIPTGGGTHTPTAGDIPVILNANMERVHGTSLTASNISITIAVSGTYRLKWCGVKTSTNTRRWGTRLYKNGTAIGTENITWTDTYLQTNTLDIALSANDVITIYAETAGNTNYMIVGNLAACVAETPIR